MEQDVRRPPGGALRGCTKREKWSGKTGGRENFERLMCHEWMQESREGSARQGKSEARSSQGCRCKLHSPSVRKLGDVF